MANRYADTLRSAPQISLTSPAIEELREFCDGITEYCQPHGSCVLQQGYLVQCGQEFRVTLIREDNQYRLILLRAYVPAQDMPVQLDTYAEELIACKSIQELRDELDRFLQLEVTRTQIAEWIR